jgi:hypothetical protein
VLARQVLNHLSHAPSSFCIVIFQIESHFYTWAGMDHDPPIYRSWNDRGIPPCPAFYWLRWGLANFLSRLASNLDPPNVFLPSS